MPTLTTPRKRGRPPKDRSQDPPPRASKPKAPKPEPTISLETWIWDAACSIRGAKDAHKYKDYNLAKDGLVDAMTEQKAGLLGSAAFVPEDDCYLHNQRFGLIAELETERLVARILLNVFNSPRFRREVSETSTGSKVRHTSPTKLRAVKVRLPSTLDEQVGIANAIDATANKMLAAERKRDVLSDLFRTLLHELMTGKVRVTNNA